MQDKHGLISMTELERLTGMAFRTIRRRIGDMKPEVVEGTTHFYSLQKVIPLLIAKEESGTLDLTQERANLAAKQARKTELIIQQMERDLIPTKTLGNYLNKIFTAMRAKCLLLHLKLPHRLEGLKSHEIAHLLKDEIHALLTELANFDIEELIHSDHEEISQDASSSPEIHGLDLGR